MSKNENVPSEKARDELGLRIPVAELHFRKLPVMPGVELAAVKMDGKTRRADYLPRISMYEYRFVSSTGVEHRRYIPREWASFVKL